MLYPEKPKDYIIEMEVAACIIEHNGDVLLVQRSPHHTHAGTWSEPGGKLEPGETHEDAMIREIYEETGVEILPGNASRVFKKYFRFVETNIAITFYKVVLDNRPQIIVCEDEHSDYIWVSPKDALSMNLIEDFDEILKEIYNL